jgi:nucleotide-binding universal stress UspA family protein
MTRLLVATDLLPKSEFALERAGLLADELGADLSLLHVVSPVSADRVLEQSLEMAIARMNSRVRRPLWRSETAPEVVVRAGNPARVILDTLASEKPSALIVGPHHRPSSVVDALAGTIVEKAVSSGNSPVLMVQQSASVAYRNVLLALDTAPASRVALRAAESLALGRGAQAAVIHACGAADHGVLRPIGLEAPDVPMHTDCSPGGATRVMRALLEQESADATRYELIVAEGSPLRAIMRAVETHKPDLLVMGTRGDGRVRRAVLGSVANQLLRAAPCDVLIVAGSTSVPVRRDAAAVPRFVPVQRRLHQHDGRDRRAHGHEHSDQQLVNDRAAGERGRHEH